MDRAVVLLKRTHTTLQGWKNPGFVEISQTQRVLCCLDAVTISCTDIHWQTQTSVEWRHQTANSHGTNSSHSATYP